MANGSVCGPKPEHNVVSNMFVRCTNDCAMIARTRHSRTKTKKYRPYPLSTKVFTQINVPQLCIVARPTAIPKCLHEQTYRRCVLLAHYRRSTAEIPSRHTELFAPNNYAVAVHCSHDIAIPETKIPPPY